MSTHYAIASILTVIISLTVGFFVILNNKKSPVNRSYFLLTLSTAVWAIGIYFHAEVYDKTWCLFWGRFAHLSASFIPIFFLQFVLKFLNLHHEKIILKIGYIFAIFFSILAFHPKFFTSVSPKASLKQWADPGFLYPLFIVFFSIFLIYTFYTILKTYPTLSSYRKNQLKYIIIASASGFLGGSTTFLTVYGIKIYLISTYVIYSVSFYNVIITYAIVKHRLMDIGIVIKKGATYSLLILLLLIPCLFLAILAQKLLFDSINYMFSFIIFILFGLATFIFTRLKPGIEKAIERILFKNKYDYKETLSELSKAMISILDKENLLKTIINTITEAMGVEKASILLIHEEKSCYYPQSYRGFAKVKEENFRLALYDPLIIWLRKHKKIIIKEELGRDFDKQELQALVKRLSGMASEICIPLLTRQKLIGICNLGNKRKGDMFSHEDLALLETLGNQAAIAIENATLYEDLKKSEAHIRRTDRLAALGTLTAGLAHEIRNPMVAIKTFVQLLPERLDDTEFMDHFLKVTSDEVDRICVLVTELLEFSRPSEPNIQNEDINEIAEKMLILVENEAMKKGTVINTNYGIGLPFVLIDKEQIKQVLLNLFLNAIEAISENGVITFKTLLINKSDSINYIRIEIGDTGEGIPKDDLEHISTPFFTTKYSGSGLGLSISYKIIQEHSGFIEVESKVGKGTTFYVDLPISSDKGSVSNGINRGVVNRRESC